MKQRQAQGLVNGLARWMGIRAPEVRLKKLKRPGWSGRYHPSKVKISVRYGRDKSGPDLERELVGHEFAHGATREVYCGGQGKRAAKNCSYRGQHDKRFYGVLNKIHKKLGTSKEKARMLESKAGYNPPHDWLDHSSSKEQRYVKPRPGATVRCVRALCRGGYTPTEAARLCRRLAGGHMAPESKRKTLNYEPAGRNKPRNKSFWDRITDSASKLGRSIVDSAATRPRSKRHYSTEISGRSYVDFQVKLARTLENKYKFSRGAAFAVAHGPKTMEVFRRGYSPQFVASTVAHRQQQSSRHAA